MSYSTSPPKFAEAADGRRGRPCILSCFVARAVAMSSGHTLCSPDIMSSSGTVYRLNARNAQNMRERAFTDISKCLTVIRKKLDGAHPSVQKLEADLLALDESVHRLSRRIVKISNIEALRKGVVKFPAERIPLPDQSDQ
eukprot:9482980-Pyramimonas_sp.AAC.2